MNENNSYLEQEETEIDLFHMMIYMLKHWKTLILAVVIGLLVGMGIFVLKQRNSTTSESEIEEYTVEPETEESMKIAYQYRQLYESQMEYNDHSFLMKMDANKVYAGELKYYISAGSDTEYITLLYQNLINSEEVLTKIKEAGALEEDEQYVKEILSCSTNRGADSYVNDLVEEAIGASSYIAKTAVINYKIIYSDKEACESMLQVLREAVEKLNDSFREKYQVYKIQEIYSSVSQSVDNGIAQKQGENISALNNYLNTVKNLESGFTGEDLLYYQTEYLQKNAIAGEEDIATIQTETDNPVKWAVIGVLLTSMLWFVYYLIMYLTDGHIKTADEVRSGFGLPIIGYIEEDSASAKGFDKWIGKIERKHKGQGDTLEYISALLKTEEAQKIFLCIDQSDEAQRAAALSIQQKCDGVEIGNMVYVDEDSLRKSKEAQKIILFIRLGCTERKDIKRCLEICMQQKILLAGTVILDK